MKKVKFISFCLMLAISLTGIVFTSCGDDGNEPAAADTTDPGTVINGVRWATRNVNAPGTFAATPESTGSFYQWNRKKAWAAAGNVSDWDSSIPSGDSWAAANDPSPEGWRVPTRDELDKLRDTEKVSSEWTVVNGVAGRRFTDLATGNSIFLPAAGYRFASNGTNEYAGMLGDYWSNTKSSNSSAYHMDFTNEELGENNDSRADGLSVRPVAE